jgi:cytochrome c oxidase assembly protein subunit 15
MVLIHVSSIMHLTNAGMGSPDWPGSYGLIAEGVATTGMEAGKAHTAASAITPSATIDRIHRVVANILQLLIIAVVFSAFLKRKSSTLRQPLLVPILALILSLFLAFLGAWYGSPLRYPWIMIINLTGGIALIGLFWWLTLAIYARPASTTEQTRRLRPWAITGLIIVTIQITLGAWTDAYYAALACTGLPGCTGADWSGSDLLRGFEFLGNLDVDASGKVMIDHTIAASIHMTHRIMALLTALYVGWLAWQAIILGGRFRLMGMIILVILAVQLGLGLAMVQFSMPITFVVAHTVTAALLVLGILNLIHYQTWQESRKC